MRLSIALVALSIAAQPAAARCHKYKVWHYNFPQKCYTAYAPPPARSEKLARREAGFAPDHETEPKGERIEVSLPGLEFEPCPEGDDRLRGIAKLRGLYDAR